jgi:hypothetical protein
MALGPGSQSVTRSLPQPPSPLPSSVWNQRELHPHVRVESPRVDRVQLESLAFGPVRFNHPVLPTAAGCSATQDVLPHLPLPSLVTPPPALPCPLPTPNSPVTLMLPTASQSLGHVVMPRTPYEATTYVPLSTPCPKVQPAVGGQQPFMVQEQQLVAAVHVHGTPPSLASQPMLQPQPSIDCTQVCAYTMPLASASHAAVKQSGCPSSLFV